MFRLFLHTVTANKYKMRTKEEIKSRILALAYYYESYSCSEGVLRILTDAYDELLPPDFLRLGSINRGGACVDGRCGILESTMLFLSYLYGRNGPDRDYSRLEYWISGIHDVFDKAMEGYTCGDIWYRRDEEISRGEYIPHTHCIIYEGLEAISDTIYDAVCDLRTAITDKTDSPGYVCSEKALQALLRREGYEWTEEQKRVATAYQKGGARGDRCGAVEMVLLLLSYKYGRLDSRETNLQDRMLSRMFHSRIQEICGSVMCRELTGLSCGVEKNCPYLEKIITAAFQFMDEADEIIDRDLDSFEV